MQLSKSIRVKIFWAEYFWNTIETDREDMHRPMYTKDPMAACSLYVKWSVFWISGNEAGITPVS